MKASELNTLQEFLTKKTLQSLKDFDFKEVKTLVSHIEKIDALRRKTWHHEKFGVYEEIAENVLKIKEEEIDTEFSLSDIPF